MFKKHYLIDHLKPTFLPQLASLDKVEVKPVRQPVSPSTEPDSTEPIQASQPPGTLPKPSSSLTYSLSEVKPTCSGRPVHFQEREDAALFFNSVFCVFPIILIIIFRFCPRFIDLSYFVLD